MVNEDVLRDRYNEIVIHSDTPFNGKTSLNYVVIKKNCIQIFPLLKYNYNNSWVGHDHLHNCDKACNTDLILT